VTLPFLVSPLIRRVAWHVRRVGGQLDRRFFLTLAQGIVAVVFIAAVLITLVEKPWTFQSIFDTFNWGIATVLGQGDSAFVTSPGGRVVGWLLILFGVAMLGMITGALVAMVIDFLLKEGQGLGASGYKDHIVVCGWNSTARDLIDELLVTSKIAARLLARSALYPGLTGIVTDIVSGGEGSELYRIRLPDDYMGLSIDAVAGRLRTEHRATLLSVNRGGRTFVNPSADFVLEPGDDAVVVAESLGTLAPLQMGDARSVARAEAAEAAATA